MNNDNQLNSNDITTNSSNNQLNPNNLTTNSSNNQLNPNNLMTNGFKKKFPPILGIVLVVLIIVITIFIGPKFFDNKKIEEPNNNNNNNITNEEPVKNEDNECLGNKTLLTGLKNETIDYYYNIDTSKFDKAKFNGDINFFGVTINGKITTNKLKNAGVTYTCKYSKKNELEVDILPEFDRGYSYCSPDFSIDASSNMTNFFVSGMDDIINPIEIRDFTKSKELYSDTGIVVLESFESYNWNMSVRNIYPKQLEVDNYKDINIDLVLEKLGNPTYVLNRTSSCSKDEYNNTVYIYVYDDVSFLFAFSNYSNLKLVGLFYVPYEYFNDDIQGLIDNEKLYKNSK